MAYTNSIGATAPSLTTAAAHTPEVAAALAKLQADPAYQRQRLAQGICTKLGQDGKLVMANGQRAVIGSPEWSACVKKTADALASGASRDQAETAAIQAAITGDSQKYLLWGLVGAVVIVGGAWYFSR